ncbi:TPA: hypothetical protein GXZ34_01890 [bacterium]|nr:hypothetical protein [bacterium]
MSRNNTRETTSPYFKNRVINYNDEIFLEICREHSLDHKTAIEIIKQTEGNNTPVSYEDFNYNDFDIKKDGQAVVVLSPDNVFSAKIYEDYLNKIRGVNLDYFSLPIDKINEGLEKYSINKANLIIHDSGKNISDIAKKVDSLKSKGYKTKLILNDFSIYDSINYQTARVIKGEQKSITNRKELVKNDYLAYSSFYKLYKQNKNLFDEYQAFYSSFDNTKEIDVNSISKNYGKVIARNAIVNMLQDPKYRRTNPSQYLKNKEKFCTVKNYLNTDMQKEKSHTI